jgi:very-short-patch-repair endonuclease
MVTEYVIFFGLLAAAFIAWIIFELNPKPIYKTKPEIQKCESPLERRMYYLLTNNGLLPYCQKRCGPYRMDFLINGWLCIEADGKAFHSSPTQKSHDRKRDSYLRENGYTVLRFSGSMIHRNPSKVINKIFVALNSKI